MNKWLNQFLTNFHKTHLKKLNFKKVRHTFSRDMNEYWERFNFQGSAWNSANDDYWTFYLNYGVEFKDLEPEKHWSFFPHTHWAGRIGTSWNYTLETDPEALMQELEAQIFKAGVKIAREIIGLRKHYLKGNHLGYYPFTEI
ncbi:hypothetical protein BH10ACI1_BH10ACI1_25920 [soil metagenome]